LWQVPLWGLVQRQIGTRALLRPVFQAGVSTAGSGRPVTAQLDHAEVKAAISSLERAQTQVNTHRTRGLVALFTADLDEARQQFQQQLVAEPADDLAYFWLGETYLRLNDIPAGMAQWVAVDAGPPILALVEDLKAQGRSTEALAALEAALEHDPGDVDAHLLAMKLWAAEGSETQLLNRYQAIISLEPRNIASRQFLARYWLAGGEPDRALTLAQEIIDLEPDRPDGYILGGDIFFSQRQYEPAITLYQEALPHAGQSRANLWVKLGKSQASLKHWLEATASYEQALDLSPDSAQTHVFLADSNCQLASPAAALTHYQQALRLGLNNERVQQVVSYVRQHGSCPP
jgi:tetratricopeptide (TPR) repeat protein